MRSRKLPLRTLFEKKKNHHVTVSESYSFPEIWCFFFNNWRLLAKVANPVLVKKLGSSPTCLDMNPAFTKKNSSPNICVWIGPFWPTRTSAPTAMLNWIGTFCQEEFQPQHVFGLALLAKRNSSPNIFGLAFSGQEELQPQHVGIGLFGQELQPQHV